MTPWRVARSLLTLRDQVNAAHPKRDKAADGTIGDARHAASISDHNPDYAGVVRALDLDHDTTGPEDARLDAHALADTLVASRDPRLKYVISRGRIARSYRKGSIAPFTWAPYTGEDPHTSHIHVSVVSTSLADSTRPWQTTKARLAPKFPGTIRLGSRGTAVKTWQKELNAAKLPGVAKLTVDGIAGKLTSTAIRNAQLALHVTRDGIAGRDTWAALHRKR
jgi:hypothetical protein